MSNLQRTILWRCLANPGAEYFNLWQESDGWQLEGAVMLALNGYPTHVHYKVICNHQWETRALDVEMQSGAAARTLRLTVDERHRWYIGDAELRLVRGCHDVDLSITPSTNTLPIRRLNLPIGESMEITAAWVRFPELTVEPLIQKYIHFDENRYWYQSENSDVITDLEVDEYGLVRRYVGGWECAVVI